MDGHHEVNIVFSFRKISLKIKKSLNFLNIFNIFLFLLFLIDFVQTIISFILISIYSLLSLLDKQTVFFLQMKINRASSSFPDPHFTFLLT